MRETLKTISAAWPMLRRAIRSGQLLRPQCRLTSPDPDIQCEYGVRIPIAEGTVLTANVFRSRHRASQGLADPVVMCAHPYDNRLVPALGNTPLGGPPQQYRLIPQSGGMPAFSTLTSWESPDPDFWVPAGYTLVNLNLPGYADSEGTAELMSHQQGEDYYAAIKWVAAQSWCDGGVGLTGVSYLAISQYYAAMAAAADGDASPLKCISPWEGVSDLYRDLACRGGVADAIFLNFWWHTEVKGPLNNSAEELAAREGALPPSILDAHPLYDDYWQRKAVDFSKVKTPMLACMSFSDHELHTPGSDRAFLEAASERKWLYTHRTGKWVAYYSEEVKQLLLDFMDCHLKGQENRFDDLPPVRLEVRSDRDTVREVRWAGNWPLVETQYRKLYLADRALAEECPASTATVSYRVDGSAEFAVTFQRDTELSGHLALKLWVEVQSDGRSAVPDDMILCCFLDKQDAQGRSVRFNGTTGSATDFLSRGYLRASRRALDQTRSQDWRPVLSGDVVEPLAPGEIVKVNVALCPIATFFAAGESLKLIIAARELEHAPIFGKDTRVNAGRHVLHCGGSYPSHLLVPEIPGP